MNLDRGHVLFAALSDRGIKVLEFLFVKEAKRIRDTMEGASGLSEDDLFNSLVELYVSGNVRVTVEQRETGIAYQFIRCDPSEAPQLHPPGVPS